MSQQDTNKPQTDEYGFEIPQIVKPDFFQSVDSDATVEPLLPIAPKKHSLRVRILMILLVLTMCLTIYLLGTFPFCFYRRAVKSLHFDYRASETVGSEITSETTIAETIAGNLQNDVMTMTASQYLFSMDGTIGSEIAEYTYTHAEGDDIAKLKIGTDGSFFTTRETIQRSANGAEIKEKGEWVSTGAAFPNLYIYCFGVAPTSRYTMDFMQSYNTKVGNEDYVCEIWLSSETDPQGTTLYHTLYRYYQNGKLSALRMIETDGTISEMQVFDIKEYSIS